MTLTSEQLELYIAKAKEHNFHTPNLTETERRLGIVTMETLSARTPEGEKLLRRRLKTVKGEDAEARRYLIVNGLIPVTPENVKGIPEFYVDAGCLPKEIVEELEQYGREHEDEADYSEDAEEDTVETQQFRLKGAWIEEGQIKSLHLIRHEKREAEAVYNTRMKEAKVIT